MVARANAFPLRRRLRRLPSQIAHRWRRVGNALEFAHVRVLSGHTRDHTGVQFDGLINRCEGYGSSSEREENRGEVGSHKAPGQVYIRPLPAKPAAEGWWPTVDVAHYRKPLQLQSVGLGFAHADAPCSSVHRKHEMFLQQESVLYIATVLVFCSKPHVFVKKSGMHELRAKGLDDIQPNTGCVCGEEVRIPTPNNFIASMALNLG